MAVVKMKKLALFAHKRDADKLLRRLMRLRCVELKKTDIEEEGEALSSVSDNGRCLRIKDRIDRTKNAIDVLSKYSRTKKGLSDPKISVRLEKFRAEGRHEAARAAVMETEALLRRDAEIKKELSSLSLLLSSLEVWKNEEVPLDFAGTDKVSYERVSFPVSASYERIKEALGDTPAHLILCGEDKSTRFYSLLCFRSFEEEAKAKLSPLGMLSVPAFADRTGNARDEIKAVKIKKSALSAESERITASLSAISEKIEDIKILYDFEATALEAEKAKSNFGATESCVLIEGFIPERDEKRVLSVLSKFECASEIGDVSQDEDVPVLLKNNFFASTFEWVLGMYSYPKYGSYDPTFIMSIFYFIIFGLMFADVGYGFILTVGCFGAIKLLNPQKGMRNFLAMFGYCGISSMAMGVLFGAYFGNMPQAYAENMLGIEGASSSMKTAVLFDPLLDPMSFLILSLAVGAVHLIAGMAVQFCILIKKGQWADALCDIATWWLTFAGIGAAVLFPWGKYVLIAGLLSIVLTQGRHEKNLIMKIGKGLLGLYGGVNFAADLLSYSRILALGLAASVIGQVINTMGTMPGPSFFGFIIMALIFTAGHLLNLVINVLGTFVHTSRLQYIEFFGKFFEDGGRPFNPVTPSDKYTKDN
ncbi:MAG: V-type ATPase 116kDa subunit family protein [Clostridia bacterium]|nr:V-type ATPase 116kDa subunit family protein [Clostridia bacterium]